MGAVVRLLVTGGRTFGVAHPGALGRSDAEAARERDMLRRALDAFHAKRGVSMLIHGDAPGADWHADRWAKGRDIAIKACPAPWEKYGAAAGPIRNAYMLSQHRPDAVLAFPGGRGTEGMVALALKAGAPVWRVLDGRIERV